MLIKDIFTYPIARRITQVIKVDDLNDEAEIAQELSEYVVTDQLESQFLEFFETYTSMRKGQGGQRDRIGVWISGFFGSGKSHFAKILGYLLSNRTVAVDGTPRQAIDVFLDRISDTSPRKQELRGLLTQVRNFFDNQTLMFMIKSHEDQLNKDKDSIALIIYRQYLQNLGFSSDLWIGRFELSLSKRGKYSEFCQKIKEITGEDWRDPIRSEFAIYRPQIAQALQAVLPQVYSTPEEANRVLDDIKASTHLSPQEVVKELAAFAEEQDKKAGEKSFKLVFIIDEIGLFIGDDNDKLLELQAIAHDFATFGQGRLWLIVTAQEAMEEVIDGVKQKRADYSRIMDRFGVQLRMTSEQIEKVLEERILKKRSAAQPTLADLFQRQEGKIAFLAVPQNSRQIKAPSVGQFERTYPFLPYYFRAMQDAFAKLRAKGGKSLQLSGAERSMLGVVQGVLNQPAAHFGNSSVGRLVTLDEIYDQILREISGDDRRTINSVAEQVPDQGYPPIKVLKALFVLTQIEWLDRTLDNIASVLAPEIEGDFNAHREKISQALKNLKAARYIIEIENQYRYLSAAERSIEDEIASEQVKSNDIRRAAREFLRNNSVNALGKVNYENGLATFDIQVYADDEPVKSTGELVLKVYSPIAQLYDDSLRVDEVRDVRSPGDEQTVYWLPGDITDPKADLERLLRLDAVVNRRNLGDMSAEERAILRDKQVELDKLRNKIGQAFNRGLFGGVIIYNGDASRLDGRNTNHNTILNREMGNIIKHVYTRFSLAAFKVSEKSIGEMLTIKSSNLPNVEPSLLLWNNQSQINLDAPVVQPILEYLKRPAVSTDGRAITDHFERIPYGWSTTVVRVTLAALFRAGTISIKVGGKYYNDPGTLAAQEGLVKTTSFRNAEFDYDPAGALTLDQRRHARSQIELLFDRQVDDTTNTLAQVLKEQLTALKTQNEILKPQLSEVPVPDLLYQGRATLDSILGQPKPDNLVKTFLDNHTFVANLQRLQRQLELFISAGNVVIFRRLLRLKEAILKAQPLVSDLESQAVRQGLEDLQVLSDRRVIVEKWDEIQPIYRQLLAAYRAAYTDLFARRTTTYQQVVSQINQFGEPPAALTDYLVAQDGTAWNEESLNYPGYTTSVYELHTDIALAPTRQTEAIQKLQAAQEKKLAETNGSYSLVTPVMIQVRDYLNGEVADADALEAKLTALSEKVRAELEQGRKVILG